MYLCMNLYVYMMYVYIHTYIDIYIGNEINKRFNVRGHGSLSLFNLFINNTLGQKKTSCKDL